MTSEATSSLGSMQFVEAPNSPAGGGPSSANQTSRIWLYGEGWVVRPTADVLREGSSWAWTNERGWFQFEDSQTSASGPASNTDNEDGNPWGSYQRTTQDYPTGRGWASSPGWSQEDHRRKDGDVPEWDGKSSERSVYFRRIDLWMATTGVRKEEQAIRLLQRLTGEAFQKLENMDAETLRHPTRSRNIQASDRRRL